MAPKGIQELPIEVLEEVAGHIAEAADAPPDLSRLSIGPSIKNPFARKTGANADLLAWASTCRSFRLSAIRYLPQLVRDITFTSFAELERIQHDRALRERLRPYVRHITLDFSVPVTISVERLKQALVVLCIHPSLPKTIFPHLEGLSFSSRFLSSYSAHGNVRRDWEQVARDQFGVDGWQAKLLGGLVSVSNVLAGGQNMLERFGDVEVLLLKWDANAGEGWDQRYDLLFQKHYPPPLEINILPSYPARLLITSFPPSTPRAPPLLVHPTYHISHAIVTRLLTTSKAAVSSPLRFFAAQGERAQNAYLLREFDEKRASELGLGVGRNNLLFDERTTAIVASTLTQQLLFTIPEPGLIDAIEEDKLQQVEMVEEGERGLRSRVVNAWQQFAS